MDLIQILLRGIGDWSPIVVAGSNPGDRTLILSRVLGPDIAVPLFAS